jgi:hypothetical protein
MDPGMSIRMTTFSIVSLLMLFVIGYAARRWHMPGLAVWQSQDSPRPAPTGSRLAPRPGG